ncbi:MAG: hypothetical protein ACO1G9_08135 [Bacteroidota bacterium]
MKLKRRKADNLPVAWNNVDEKALLTYLKKGDFDAKLLKKLFPNRTLPSIRSKVRKLRIKHDLFGSTYRNEKENFTIRIAKKVKPKIVFDCYAGAGHQTFKWIEEAEKVYASEIMLSKLSQFNKTAKNFGFEKVKTKNLFWKKYKKGEKEIYLYLGDVIDAAAELKVGRIKIDLVDLDTCGSSIPVLPIILVLLKPRHVVITHGEFHSMRFKRQDVLQRLLMHRDIRKNPLPLNVKQMEEELDKAVKTAGLRAHNETSDSFWLDLRDETWLGGRFHGMLRRYYKTSRPIATADCINSLVNLKTVIE